MAECFTACHSGDLQGVSKSDLDRYTDKIDTLLSEESGRRLFRGFLITTERDCIKCLELWEDCNNAIRSRKLKTSEKKSFDEFLVDVRNILEKSEEIEELNVASIKHLIEITQLKNEKKIVKGLKSFKIDLTNIMRSDYEDFKKHILNIMKHL